MLRFFVFYIVFIVCTAQPAFAEWAEQSCRSAHRLPVTLTTAAAALDGEVRIDLSDTDMPPLYTFSPQGDDVRVFLNDDITPVDFAVTAWDPAARSATIFVRPTIPASTTVTLYIYFGDPDLASLSDAPTVFPEPGIRLHSRVSMTDPTSASSALAAFAAATIDVDNTVRASITGLNNRAIGGTASDYGWCVSSILNVTAADAGLWQFRYGGDFGRGGHLYVSGQALEEDWNNDLWWAGSYANPAETLSGSITLAEGWHRYEALGFEGCCDGATGFQARAPGGAWQDLSSANFTMRGARCIPSDVTVSVGAHESCVSILDASKTVSVVSAPGGGGSLYALPGSVVKYDLKVENPGQKIDASTVVLTDALPSEVRIGVTVGSFVFTDGAVASGLGFTYGGPSDVTDSVEFSTDGIDFTYVPSGPFDASVTHVRLRPTGAFNANDAGNKPGFTVSFLAEVK